MYNLIEYSDNFSKISGILWQYYKDEPALAKNGDLTDLMNVMSLVCLNLKKKKQKKKKKKKSMQQWNKKYWNNGTIKTSK